MYSQDAFVFFSGFNYVSFIKMQLKIKKETDCFQLNLEAEQQFGLANNAPQGKAEGS